MADFTARITTACTIVQWTDPALFASPTRLNARADHPHVYLRVAEGLASMELAATVGGVEGPADAALGGRLFKWSWVEYPNPGPPAITSPAGSTSICNLTGTPFNGRPGHYTILCWRDGGGAVGITWEVR